MERQNVSSGGILLGHRGPSKDIGGSAGRPRMPHQHIVIAIGLTKFISVNGQPALNSTFVAYFINLVGHIFSTTVHHTSLQRHINNTSIFFVLT
jgi:hypothetical protein